MQQLTTNEVFPTYVYDIDVPELLPLVRDISLNSLKGKTPEHPAYPMVMGSNLEGIKEMQPFCEFVGKTAHRILIDQGYDVRNKSVQFSELWCQEHRKYSSMERHVHGNGVQLVGFYFIDVSPNSMAVTLHDPRSAKVQAQEKPEDPSMPTYASTKIDIIPYPGLLIFTDAWLPHSFSRNLSDDPVRFIHFNICTVENYTYAPSDEPSVEVI